MSTRAGMRVIVGAKTGLGVDRTRGEGRESLGVDGVEIEVSRKTREGGATPLSKQQQQRHHPTPQRGLRMMRRTKSHGR